MRKRDERRRFWTALIARFERSGSSRKAFAAEAGVGVAIFQYWLYKLRRERLAISEQPQAPEVRLVPVTVHAPVRAGGQVDLRVAGVRLRVPVGTDPRYVAELAAALRDARAC
jgi:hypothetical protein